MIIFMLPWEFCCFVRCAQVLLAVLIVCAGQSVGSATVEIVVRSGCSKLICVSVVYCMLKSSRVVFVNVAIAVLYSLISVIVGWNKNQIVPSRV